MKNLILILLVICAITACTRLDIAISWADTFIVSQVDDYFDITSEQSADLKSSIKKDITKVRKDQFPVWAAEMRKFEKDLDEGKLTAESFHEYFDRALKTSRTIQPFFSDSAVKFISTATPAQLEKFERTLRKKNVDDEKKIESSKKARNEGRKKYLRWVDMWIDSLSKDQTQLLEQHLATHPFPALAQIRNKNYVLDKFTEARKTPEGLKSFVRDYYNNRYQFFDPEYVKALSSYQAELEKFMFSLLQTLSDKQKKHLRENLTSKAADLEKLAAKE